VTDFATRPRLGAPPVRVSSGDNSKAQRTAWKRLSLCERETGQTAEQLAAGHAEQRARVLARLGIEAAA